MSGDRNLLIPLQAGNIPQANPLDPLKALHSAVGIAKDVQAIDYQKRRIQALDGLGEIMATHPDPDDAFNAMRQSPFAAWAPEALAQIRAADQTSLALSKERYEMDRSAMGNFAKSLPELMANPSVETLERLKKSQVDAMPDLRVKERIKNGLDDWGRSLTENLSADPATARKQMIQRIAGKMIGSDVTADKIAMAFGRPEILDIGSERLPGWQGGMFTGQGQFTPSGAGIPVGAPPGYREVGGILKAVPAIQPGAGVEPATGTAPVAPVTRETLPAPGTTITPAPAEVSPAATAAGATGAAEATTGPASPAAGAAAAKKPLPQIELPVEQMRQKGWVEGSLKNMEKYSEDLNNRVSGGGILMQQIDEMRDLSKKFRTGPPQVWQQPLAKFLASIYMSQDIVDKVAGGSLAAAQEAEKLFVSSTMSQLRGQLPPGSRLNIMEWTAFRDANPNLVMMPDAIERIFNFWGRQYAYNVGEAKALTKYMAEGKDPAGWAAEWSEQSRKQGFFKTEPVAGEAAGSTPRRPLEDIDRSTR